MTVWYGFHYFGIQSNTKCNICNYIIHFSSFYSSCPLPCFVVMVSGYKFWPQPQKCGPSEIMLLILKFYLLLLILNFNIYTPWLVHVVYGSRSWVNFWAVANPRPKVKCSRKVKCCSAYPFAKLHRWIRIYHCFWNIKHLTYTSDNVQCQK